MTLLHIERGLTIRAPLEDVWKTTAEDFDRIDRWDGNVRTAQKLDSPPPEGAPVGGRTCQMYRGASIVERLVEYDPSTYRLAYRVEEGLPGFVALATNHWSHSEVEEGTLLELRLELETRGPLGVLMSLPLRLQMGKVLGRALEELKFFVETGSPHPRKVARVKRSSATT
ncbi:MAG: SRPBCC family protein [Acidobacteriota bacterium]